SEPWPEALDVLGSWTGWLALVPAACGLIWHLRNHAAKGAVHALAISALLAGVLLACTVAPMDVPGTWLAQHTLTLSWAVAAGGLLAAAWLAEQVVRWRAAVVPEFAIAATWWSPLVEASGARAWVAVIGAALVAIALGGGATDPLRPW